MQSFRRIPVALGILAIVVGLGLFWRTLHRDSGLDVSSSGVSGAGHSNEDSGAAAPSTPHSSSTGVSAATPTLSTTAPALTTAAQPEVSAVVRLADNKTVALQPNALGLFPRVLLEKDQTVPISVTYPDGEPGEVLVISAEDGGRVNNGIPVQTAALDAHRQINFRFTTTRNEGVYRVTLQRGAEKRQFDFWVGPAPALQTALPVL